MQPPSIVVVSTMPYQTCMLEKSRASIVHSLSHREAKDILARHGATTLNLSVLGSRHKYSSLQANDAMSPVSDDLRFATTHTVYKKSESLMQVPEVDCEIPEVDADSTESQPVQ